MSLEFTHRILSNSMEQSYLWNLLVVQLVKEFPHYEECFPAFTTEQNFSLSWTRRNHCTFRHPVCSRSISIFSRLCLCLPINLFPSGFPTQILYASLSFSTGRIARITYIQGDKRLYEAKKRRNKSTNRYHHMLEVTTRTVTTGQEVVCFNENWGFIMIFTRQSLDAILFQLHLV